MIDLAYLKEQRTNKGMTLMMMSELLDYESPNGFWKLENGLTRLRADQLMRLVTALNMDVNKLLKEE